MDLRRNKEDGYTLTELIVTFALTCMLLLCGTVVLTGCMRVWIRTGEMLRGEMVSEILLGNMEKELAERCQAEIGAGQEIHSSVYSEGDTCQGMIIKELTYEHPEENLVKVKLVLQNIRTERKFTYYRMIVLCPTETKNGL